MATRQTVTPNVNIWATPGYCLGYVDDAIGAPASTRTSRALYAYRNELNAGRIRMSNAPVGIWVIGFLDFTKGSFTYPNGATIQLKDYGHVFLMKKRSDGSIEIHDSEVHSGMRGIYNSIEEVIAWFGMYGPVWAGFSYACDGVVIAEDYNDAPPAASNQRIVASAGANVRTGAGTSFPMAVENGQPLVYDKGVVLTGKGFMRGESVNGSDLWFVGISGTKFIHFSNFSSFDTAGLADLTPVVPPVSTPDVFPAPTNDPLVTGVVNKKNPNVPINYVPSDLVDISGNVLRKEAADSLRLMMNKVALVPKSGYRSYESQKTLYEGYLRQDPQEVVDTYSARPGFSEHQTGLVMDFMPIATEFETTPAFKWLSENAHKYGWILRYPKGKEAITGYMYEPWHWRYVGVKMATDIRIQNTTLEEFVDVPGGGYYPVPVPSDPDYSKENNALLKQILALLRPIIDKFNGIFR